MPAYNEDNQMKNWQIANKTLEIIIKSSSKYEIKTSGMNENSLKEPS